MISGIGRRGRGALCGAAIAGVAAGLGVSERLPDAHGAALALLWLEAAVCGAAAGGATAGFFGGEGVAGSARALWGGAVATALGLSLFAGGAGLWLKAVDGAAALSLADMAAAFAPLALTAALSLHGLELLALRLSAWRDAESL